ncbi:hypothetical protein YC2023_006879 [Brassica napus]
MNLEVEPPCKKKKQDEPSHPSFLSLPDVIILNCLARVSKSYYPKLSLVSKTFRSLILSIELNHARFHHKTNEISFHVCLQLPDRPLPSYWFTLLIDLEMKKSTLAQVPSIYAPIVPRIMLTVASQVLISYVTGQTGLIFTLPDVSGPPLLKLIKSGSCCLLVDNVAVFFLSSKLTLKPLKTSFTSANSSPIIIFPPGSCFSLWIKPDQTLTNDLGKKAT